MLIVADFDLKRLAGDRFSLGIGIVGHSISACFPCLARDPVPDRVRLRLPSGWIYGALNNDDERIYQIIRRPFVSERTHITRPGKTRS
jgi:hypothetical protein